MSYDDTDLKVDLVEKIKAASPTKQFKTDVIAEEFTHTVLRLPVAHHRELSPIELAWSVVKGYVAKHNNKFTVKEVEGLLPKAIKIITPAMWEKFCNHTVKVEEFLETFCSHTVKVEEFWKRDGLVEDVVEEILIRVSSGSDDESDDEPESDDDDIQDVQPESASTLIDPAPEEKQCCCSRQLQLEHTGTQSLE